MAIRIPFLINSQLFRFLAVAFLQVFSFTAFAKIDVTTISHQTGPCGARNFPVNGILFPYKDPVPIVTGEKIQITLYGFGADFAQDAVGNRIHEWIHERGNRVFGNIGVRNTQLVKYLFDFQ